MGARSIAAMAVILAALWAVYLLTGPPADAPEEAPRPALWSAQADDLVAVTIALPSAGKEGAWIKGANGDWYDQKRDGRNVDVRRWGGGIPLLLSGPKAERLIAAAPAPEQLAAYGLLRPRMTVDLVLKGEQRIGVEVGDPTPDGSAYYVRVAARPQVYTVHATWFGVLERLVLDPP
jgi:Domain of unknown function (DUF4340)